ncbi:MAG: S41 family peptidase [Sumerlaeia bacterium]
MMLWKRAPKSDRLFFLAAVGLLTLSLTLVGLRDQRIQADSAEEEEFYRFVDLAAEIYSEISTKYVDDVEAGKVLEAGLAGMFDALDEHSQYMSPDMLDALDKDTSGEFSGIGIHITKQQGVLTVIAPIPGSPAAKLGLQPYDRIIEIEGETTEDMELTDAVRKLTGPSGTSVSFKVYRDGETEPLDFTVTRASVAIDSVFHTMLQDGVGYARIARFSENTSRDLRKAILDMKSQGMEGLVLDLRFNTGGLLREAIDVSDLFTEKGALIVSTKGRMRSQNREYRAMNDPLTRVPLFVLVNEGSASASEIVAGAIQDHRLGVVIGPSGKNTFGKGSVQQIINLGYSLEDDENGNPRTSAVRLTSAKYYTPSGRTIHQIGVTPDIGVPLPEGHERELLTHGLLGDVRIDRPEGEDEEGVEAPESTEIDDPQSAPMLNELKEESKEAPSKAFYELKKPEEKEDTFVDVMLEEALKQLKIYMILQDKQNRAPYETIAARDDANSVVAR